MAILATDYMDFGNGIIGDDTFDVWRKKTNRIQVNLDSINTALDNKINTLIATLPNTYIPIGSSGSVDAKTVYTSLSFNGKTQILNAMSQATAFTIGSTDIYEYSNKLQIEKQVNSLGFSANKIAATSNITLGTKEYVVPQSPGINNAILTTTTGGALEWKSAGTLLQLTGGNVTTNVFEQPMPVGTVIATAGPISDSNYLLCDGGSYFKTGIYGDLYAVIGDRYGVVENDSSKFRVPDYRGRIPVGQGAAGGVTFASDANPFGVTGGTGTTTTEAHSLSIGQIPAHRHLLRDDNGHTYLALNDENRRVGATGSSGANAGTLGSDAFDSQGPNEAGQDTAISQTTYTGGGAEGGIHGGNTTKDNVDASGFVNANSHSHNLSASNRLQPYITTQYFIKAIKNNKADFKINIQNSGLISTDTSGAGQTLIEPVDGTVTLKIKTDTEDTGITENSIRVEGTNLRIATSPYIQGSPIIRGVDFRHYNDTRAGGAGLHTGRFGVHGNGLNNSKTILNPPLITDFGSDHDLKAIYPLWSQHKGAVTDYNPGGQGASTGKGADNDTYIINYSSYSPSANGDYTGGVIINGTRSIAFQDGSVQHTAYRQGRVKRLVETSSGKHNTVSAELGDAMGVITDDNNICVGGYNQYNAQGQSSVNRNIRFPTSHSSAAEGYGSGKATQFLPDGEKADKLYIADGASWVLTKNQKIYGMGIGWLVPTHSTTSSNHENDHYFDYVRAFCEIDTVKFSKVVHSSDISVLNVCALDTRGYLWGHGHNWGGQLAQNLQSYQETSYDITTDITAKRDNLASVEGGYNIPTTGRSMFAHVTNPMLDSGGNITTTVSDGVSLVKFTDAALGGSWYTGDSNVRVPHYVIGLGADKKLYHVGYNGLGQASNNTTANTKSDWSVIQKSATSTDHLENIERFYIGGEDFYTYAYAIDTAGDVWGWGANKTGVLGNGSTQYPQSLAEKSWIAGTQGYKANYILTNDAASETTDSIAFLVSHETSDGTQTQKRVWYAGRNENGEAGVGNTTQQNTWTQITNGPFDTNTYDLQEIYLSNGNVRNRAFALSRNKSTGILELWAAGNNLNTNLGRMNPAEFPVAKNVSAIAVNVISTWMKISFASDLTEKIIKIQSCRQYRHHESTGGSGGALDNTFIHTSDGRLFGAGFLGWGWGGLLGYIHNISTTFTELSDINN